MDFDDIRGAFDFGQDDYLVLVTRGHQHDQRILEQIYDCQARYIGMIGSSKISKMWKRLEAKGIAQAISTVCTRRLASTLAPIHPKRSASASWPKSSASGVWGKSSIRSASAAMTGAARRLPCPVEGRGEAVALAATRRPPTA